LGTEEEEPSTMFGRVGSIATESRQPEHSRSSAPARMSLQAGRTSLTVPRAKEGGQSLKRMSSVHVPTKSTKLTDDNDDESSRRLTIWKNGEHQDDDNQSSEDDSEPLFQAHPIRFIKSMIAPDSCDDLDKIDNCFGAQPIPDLEKLESIDDAFKDKSTHDADDASEDAGKKTSADKSRSRRKYNRASTGFNFQKFSEDSEPASSSFQHKGLDTSISAETKYDDAETSGPASPSSAESWTSTVMMSGISLESSPCSSGRQTRVLDEIRRASSSSRTGTGLESSALKSAMKSPPPKTVTQGIDEATSGFPADARGSAGGRSTKTDASAKDLGHDGNHDHHVSPHYDLVNTGTRRKSALYLEDVVVRRRRSTQEDIVSTEESSGRRPRAVSPSRAHLDDDRGRVPRTHNISLSPPESPRSEASTGWSLECTSEPGNASTSEAAAPDDAVVPSTTAAEAAAEAPAPGKVKKKKPSLSKFLTSSSKLDMSAMLRSYTESSKQKKSSSTKTAPVGKRRAMRTKTAPVGRATVAAPGLEDMLKKLRTSSGSAKGGGDDPRSSTTTTKSSGGKAKAKAGKSVSFKEAKMEKTKSMR